MKIRCGAFTLIELMIVVAIFGVATVSVINPRLGSLAYIARGVYGNLEVNRSLRRFSLHLRRDFSMARSARAFNWGLRIDVGGHYIDYRAERESGSVVRVEQSRRLLFQDLTFTVEDHAMDPQLLHLSILSLRPSRPSGGVPSRPSGGVELLLEQVHPKRGASQ